MHVYNKHTPIQRRQYITNLPHADLGKVQTTEFDIDEELVVPDVRYCCLSHLHVVFPFWRRYEQASTHPQRFLVGGHDSRMLGSEDMG